jgi:hypothetical protein
VDILWRYADGRTKALQVKSSQSDWESAGREVGGGACGGRVRTDSHRAVRREGDEDAPEIHSSVLFSTVYGEKAI